MVNKSRAGWKSQYVNTWRWASEVWQGEQGEKKRLLNVIDPEFLQQIPAGRLLHLHASACSNIWKTLFLFVIKDTLRHLENTVFPSGLLTSVWNQDSNQQNMLICIL